MQSCQQWRAASKIICSGQVRQCNEDRADSKISELAIALRMINSRCRMVTGGVDGCWQTSTEPFHSYADILPISTNHR